MFHNTMTPIEDNLHMGLRNQNNFGTIKALQNDLIAPIKLKTRYSRKISTVNKLQTPLIDKSVTDSVEINELNTTNLIIPVEQQTETNIDEV